MPVDIDVTEQAGITVSGFEIAIAYDPSIFTVGTVAQLGPMFSVLGSPIVLFPTGSWVVFSRQIPQLVQVRFPSATTTDLFSLSFTVNSNASNGPSVINLLHNIQTRRRYGRSSQRCNLTQLTLSPAPTNAATDSVDGTFQVGTVTTCRRSR